MNALKNIERLHRVIDRSLFYIDGSLDYDRVTEALIKLSNLVIDTETDESIWYIGECGNATLDAVLIGAYWHFTEWHSGQWSKGYAALSAIGEIFSPGMSDIDEEREAESAAYDVYLSLDVMAKLTQIKELKEAMH